MFASLTGSNALIVGASRGIGKGIADAFAKHGCNVFLISRNKQTLSDTAKQIGAKYPNSRIECLAGDASDTQVMKQATQQCVDAFGGLDKVVMNAGVFPQCPIESMEEAEWDLVFNTNIKSVFNTVKASVPYLKSATHGRVILTSSITGPITGYAGWAHYGATKAAMLGFMRSAAIELAPFQISINAILPGNVVTEGVQEMGEQYIEDMRRYIPLNRLGTTEEIASVALFLASKECSFMTGQTIVVDGGQTLPECIDT